MPGNLADLELAELSEEQIMQLRSLEREFNQGRDQEVYLIAVNRPVDELY